MINKDSEQDLCCSITETFHGCESTTKSEAIDNHTNVQNDLGIGQTRAGYSLELDKHDHSKRLTGQMIVRIYENVLLLHDTVFSIFTSKLP